MEKCLSGVSLFKIGRPSPKRCLQVPESRQIRRAALNDGRRSYPGALVPGPQGCGQQRCIQPKYETAHLGLAGRLSDDLELQAAATRLSLLRPPGATLFCSHRSCHSSRGVRHGETRRARITGLMAPLVGVADGSTLRLDRRAAAARALLAADTEEAQWLDRECASVNRAPCCRLLSHRREALLRPGRRIARCACGPQTSARGDPA